MAVVFVSNQLQDFVLPNVQASEQAFAGYYDTSWVPFCIRHFNSADHLFTLPFTALTEAWFHWEMRVTNFDIGVRYFIVRDSSGVDKLRLYCNNGNYDQSVEYWNGSAWVGVTNTGNGNAQHDKNVLLQNDLHVKINGASSTITWYVNKIEIFSATGDFSAIGNIASVGICNPDNGAGFGFSQLIVADENTIMMKYKLVLPNANGATQQWTGSYTDIDDVGINNADFAYTTTANQVSTFKNTVARDFTNYTIKFVRVKTLALKGPGGPQNIQMALRIGGVDYFSANRTMTYGFSTVFADFATNPATGVAWTPTQAADVNVEFGMKSIT